MPIRNVVNIPVGHDSSNLGLKNKFLFLAFVFRSHHDEIKNLENHGSKGIFEGLVTCMN